MSSHTQKILISQRTTCFGQFLPLWETPMGKKKKFGVKVPQYWGWYSRNHSTTYQKLSQICQNEQLSVDKFDSMQEQHVLTGFYHYKKLKCAKSCLPRWQNILNRGRMHNPDPIGNMVQQNIDHLVVNVNPNKLYMSGYSHSLIS